VERQADKIYQPMLPAQQRTNASMLAPIKPPDWLNQARETLLRNQDPSQGGLSNGATKFPQEPALNLLLADFVKGFLDWAARKGLDRAKIAELYNAPSTTDKINQARSLAQAYNVQVVPMRSGAKRFRAR
jgi:hypothetical protein